jgi:hypothetical protein
MPFIGRTLEEAQAKFDAARTHGGTGPRPVGTPEMVADELEKWALEADVDGFNLSGMSKISLLPIALFGPKIDTWKEQYSKAII